MSPVPWAIKWWGRSIVSSRNGTIRPRPRPPSRHQAGTRTNCWAKILPSTILQAGRIYRTQPHCPTFRLRPINWLWALFQLRTYIYVVPSLHCFTEDWFHYHYHLDSLLYIRYLLLSFVSICDVNKYILNRLKRCGASWWHSCHLGSATEWWQDST